MTRWTPKKRTSNERRKVRKMRPSARLDPAGPRLLPLDDEPEPAVSPLTGFGWVSLADTALKVWDESDKRKKNK